MVVPRNAPVGGHAYKTRHVEFGGCIRRIVLQGVDGPCSLIAICNRLILQGTEELPNQATFFQEELLHWVAKVIIDFNGNEKEVWDTTDLLQSLATGLLVNIKFSSIKDFAPTPELGIFHLLDIPLYHGCLVNPKYAMAIGSKSFDELSSEVVVAPDLTPQKSKRNIVPENRGEQIQSNPYGLSCLQRDVGEEQLCVLFHNEHFSTMFKYGGELYLLASHEAFLNEPDRVWEKLNEVERGKVYVDSNFKECKMDYHGNINSAALTRPDTSGDEPLARRLQQQEQENADLWSPGG